MDAETNGHAPAARMMILQPDNLCREGLSRIVREFPGVQLAGLFGSGAELLRIARDLYPDVVLMEIDLGAEDGLELIRALERLSKPPVVVILSRQMGYSYVAAAFATGASGYLPRSAGPGEVREAIRQVLHGHKYVHPSLAEVLVGGNLVAPHQEKLSERECLLLIELGRGATNQEIAERLYLSEKTVRNSLTRLFRKLHSRNRLEAVASAREKAYL